MTQVDRKTDQCSPGSVKDGETGIRSLSKEKVWLVPPWPPGAGVCEVVSQFSRFQPTVWSTPTERLAYYQGFVVALRVARIDDPLNSSASRWYDDLLGCVSCTATSLEAEQRETAGEAVDPRKDPQRHEDEHIREIKEKTGAN